MPSNSLIAAETSNTRGDAKFFLEMIDSNRYLPVLVSFVICHAIGSTPDHNSLYRPCS